RNHRLVPGRRRVDDRQSTMTKPYTCGLVEPYSTVIGAAVQYGLRHPGHDCLDVAPEVHHPCQSTHENLHPAAASVAALARCSTSVTRQGASPHIFKQSPASGWLGSMLFEPR